MTEAEKMKPADVEGLVETGRDSMNRGLGNSAICTTAADTAAKAVTMGSTFELIEGAMVIVEFQNGITVANATLAVTHTPLGAEQPTVEAAKPIYYNGAALGANIVPAGAVVMMRYNGTAFKIVGIIGSSGSGSEAAYTPTLQSAPTSSTLTYTKDGETHNFEIGQFCRVPDATMDTGYKFYQLYDIKNNAAVWQEMGVLYSRLVLSVGSNQSTARTAALRSSAVITVKNSSNETVFSGTVEQAVALKLETSETYTISAAAVNGYTTPQSQSITTSIGSLDSVEMVYNTTELTVAKAVNADGDVNDVSSGTVAVYDMTDSEEPVEIPAGADGKYLIPIGTPIKVTFGDVTGYNTPEDQTATYSSPSNATATITGTYTCVAYTVNVATNQQTHTDIAATVVRVTFGNEHTDLTGAQGNTIVRVPVGTTPTAAVQSGTPTGYDSVINVDSTNHTISALFRTEVVTISLAANVNQAGLLAEKPKVTVVSTERGTIYDDDYEGAVTLKVKPTDACTVSVESATNFATPSQESFTAGTTGSRSITMEYLATLISLNMVGEDAGVEGNFPTGAKGTVSYNGGSDQELSDNSTTAQVPQGTSFSVNYANVNGYVTPSDYSGTATGNSMTVTKATYVKIQNGAVTTLPTAKTLTYTGSSQQLINAGAGTGTMMYKLGDGSWSSSIPEATNAGTYTIKYKAAASTYYYESAEGEVEVTLAKAAPTYTAPTAKSDLTYNGSAQDLLNAGSTNDGTIKYSSDNENWSTSIPQSTNASDSITVYWKLEGDANHTDVASTSISCSIAKATPTYTAPTAKSGLVYTGSAQDLLNAGSTSDGTIQYSSDNENWGTSIPQGTNGDTYTVYWRLVGDVNHNDVTSTSISVLIKAIPTYTTPVAKSDLVYSGSAQDLLTAGETEDGTIQYSSDGSSWSTSLPQGTNAGAYTVYWRLVGDATHDDVGSTSINVSIEKATGSVTTAPIGGTKAYTGSSISLVSAGSGTGTMLYSLDGSIFSSSIPTATAVGDYTVYYKCNSTSNYTESAIGSVSCSIKYLHNGHEYVDLGLPSGTKWATMNLGASEANVKGSTYTYARTSSYTGTENPLSVSQDHARNLWGGSWRTPTKVQWDELFNNTTHVMDKSESEWKHMFTAPNGNKIIIYGGDVNFWTSTPASDNNQSTGYYIATDGSHWSFNRGRSDGMCKRPVFK